ncbi:MAG: hypothetical protein KC592_12630 [Nitrospira sp.]|nr:hypothetical protein [Nitrospira sp.]
MKNTKAERRLKDLQRLKELERDLLLQPRMKELMQACMRVGLKPGEALGWISDFCKWDLDQLSDGDWQNLIYEVVWFAIYGPAIPGTEFVPSGDYLQDLIHDPNSRLPSQKMIEELQQWAKARLGEFIEDGETYISLQPASVLMVKRDRKTARAEMMLKTNNLYQGFAFSFAHTLREAGARLNQCPECGKYYPARSNQTYCSPRCQNRVSLQKFRTKAQPASRASKKPGTRKQKPKR